MVLFLYQAAINVFYQNWLSGGFSLNRGEMACHCQMVVFPTAYMIIGRVDLLNQCAPIGGIRI
jgi:hypothetical protein